MYKILISKLNRATSYIDPVPSSLDSKAQKRVLIIHAHPLKESFSGSILRAVVKGLEYSGHFVRVRSLYNNGSVDKDSYGNSCFNPLLTAKERSGCLIYRKLNMLNTTVKLVIC